MTQRLTVVVPVYFNEPSLRPLFDQLVALEPELEREAGLKLQLVFVDDGSKDGSLKRLLELKAERPGTTVVKLSRNFGAVHASRTGLRFVEGDCFMILAADLQDPPSLIVEMAKAWRAGPKFVIAARESRDDPWTSRVYSWLYYRLLRFLVVPGYPEGGFDIALMDRAMLDPMRNCSKNAFTPLLAYWLGYEAKVLTYHRPKRPFGKSGWTFRKKFKAFLDVMLGFSVTPIRLISAVGVVVSAASFLYGISVVVGAILGRIPVGGFATVVALITFLLGLIIIMLGVIGEYLWRIFDEVNRRPETVIDEVF